MTLFGFFRRPADQPAQRSEAPPAPPLQHAALLPPAAAALQAVIAPAPKGLPWRQCDFVQDMLAAGASAESVIWVLRYDHEIRTAASPSVTAVTVADDVAANATLERLRRRRERDAAAKREKRRQARSEEHTSELQSLR